MNPPPSTFGSSTLGAAPALYSVSQEKPCVMTRRWLNCFCGADGVHGFFGSKSVAISYWSRSMWPVSSRTMNGPVTPSVVVVASTSSSAGGFFGSYAWNAPPLLFEVVPGSAAPSWVEPFRTYRNLYDGALLHLASFAPVWQVHGLI